MGRRYLTALAILASFTLSTASTTINYGDELTAYINALGESHNYNFDATAGDKILLRMRGTSGGVDACMELFDPSGTSIGEACDDGGIVFFDGLLLESTGTYTIVSQDHEDNDTGEYGLSLTLLNNPQASEPIICTTDLEGNFAHQTQVDAYAYTGDAGDLMVLQMRSVQGNIESQLRLYDPSGNLLAEALPNGGLSRIDAFVLPETGTYTVLCMDKNGNDLGDYGFSIQWINTSNCATPLECGVGQTATLDYLVQMHAYSIDVNEGNRVYLRMRGDQGVEAELQLYDPNGVLVASDAPSSGMASIENYLATSSGTYFVMARDGAGNDAGNYGIIYRNLGDEGCSTLLDCDADFNGSLEHLAELDVYRVEGLAGDKFWVQARCEDTSVEEQIEWYDANGNQLSIDISGGGLASIEETTLPADGTYYVFFCDKSGNDTGDYGFGFQKTTNAHCVAAIDCEDVYFTNSFSNLAEIQTYTISATAGDLISITMIEEEASLEPTLCLCTPDGNILFDSTASHDISIEGLMLPETGNYLLLAMDRHGNDVGGYNLAISGANCPDLTPPVVEGCSDLTINLEDLVGNDSETDSPLPANMEWGGYNMKITFDSSVESIPGTCLFGNMTIVDYGCVGIRTACYGNILQFTPDYNTCQGPFPALPFTIDFGTGLVVTFDEGGNATIDSYGGGSSAGSNPIDNWLSEVNATDEEGDATISNNFDPDGFSCMNGSGTQTVIFTATDENDNTTTCEATITVVDNTPPTPTVEALYPLFADCEISLEIPTATDACSGTFIDGTTDSPMTFDEQGEYIVVWTYTDDNGNTTFQEQEVIIENITLSPIPTADYLVDVSGDCEVTLTTPTATNACTGELIYATTNDPTSFTEQGTYTVVWYYTDDVGNITEQEQTVTVVNSVNPIPIVTSLNTLQADCDIELEAPTATDACTGNVIIGQTSDPMYYDEQGSYTVTWTYEDASGNTTTQSQSIIVEDVTEPITACEDLTLTLDESGFASVEQATLAGNSYDECGVNFFSTIPFEFTCEDVGENEVEFSIVDVNGNSTFCAVTITIVESAACNEDPEETVCGDLPNNYEQVTIGAGEGEACYEYGTDSYTLSSQGGDIYGTKDNFQFVHTNLNGSYYFKAKLNEMTATSGYPMAGVMMRKKINIAGSKNVGLLVTADGDLLLQVREKNNNYTAVTNLGAVSLPIWLKLEYERSDKQVLAYTSTNGGTWDQVGAASINLNNGFYAGMATSSFSATAENIANFQYAQSGSISSFTGGSNLQPSTDFTILDCKDEHDDRADSGNCDNPSYAAKSAKKQEKKIDCYPNPALDQIFIDLEDFETEIVEVMLLSLTGQLVWHVQKEVAVGEHMNINLLDLPLEQGYYRMSVRSGKKIISKPIFILRPED